MIRRFLAVPVIVLTLSAAAHIAAQQPDRAALLLRAAQQKETVEGDLAGAIKQYEAIVSTYGKTNRPVAAKALLRMAAAYQRRGDAQAQTTWARIVAEFADQGEAVAEARMRMAAGGSTPRPSPSLPVSRMVTGHYSTADTVTPDGRFLAGTDWNNGDLLVRDLTTRQERRPVSGRAPGGRLQDFAQSPAFSPDMSQIAYSWFSEDASGRTSNSLRIVSTKVGSAPREIVRREYDSGWLDVVGWSPDARSLLVTLNGPLPNRSAEIAWVSIETGASRTLKTFEPWQVVQAGRALGKVSLSPDGRWIAYSMLSGRDRADRHIQVLAADGSGQSQLTMTAGVCTDPVWATDGSNVAFVADWSGSFGLWVVPVRDGKPGGPPVLVKADIGRIDAIGVTAAGSYYYNYRYDGGFRTFVVRTTGSPGAIAAPDRITADFAGGLAAWSPDGARVAFIRQRTSGGRTINELGIRVAATGEERVLNARAVSPQRPLWFHRREALLVFGPDDSEATPTSGPVAVPPFMSGGAFFSVDLATGRFTRVLPVLSDRYRRSPFAVLSADDRTLYSMGDPLSSSQVSFDDLLAVDLTQQTERVIASVSSPGDWRRTPAGVDIALSPDGRTLAVASRAGNRDGNRPWRSEQSTLFVVDVDGKDQRELHGPYVSSTVARVAWSRDGRTVNFVRESGANDQVGWEVMSAPREGGTPRPTGLDLQTLRKALALTSSERSERLTGALHSLDLHPAGASLLISSDVNPKFEIWALDGVTAASRR
jgi:Tol biopolymer transport system component